GQPQSSVPPGTPNYPMAVPGPRGVRGQAQGGMPPTPNYPTMMADGGMMGDTSPIGGMPDDDTGGQGATPGDGSDPTQGAGGPQMGMGATVTPEALHYHDEPQNCAGCMHLQEGGQCEVL